MHTVKGELDLYIYDRDGTLVRHHTQSNYDTIRARLDPNFSATCDRVTRFECDKEYEYPRPVQYGERTIIPIYLDEPLFVPDHILPLTNSGGDGHYAVSYDKGTTWWTHDGISFTEVTIPTADSLRLQGMNGTSLEAMDIEVHMEKYEDHIVIMATPDALVNVIYGYEINMDYHSSLIDPYYIRWIGDLSVLPRYTLETLPISSSKSGNTYTINISNLAGVTPIDLDTILTKVGNYIGTFTYVGLTVEIDQILVGSYTISVSSDQAVFSQRTSNAKYSFWGRTNPTYSDGVLGGVRHHGAESRCYLYTYNGGPSENIWMFPFLPDRELRRTSLKRSIGLPFTPTAEYGENTINPDYGLLTTGGIQLWSVEKDHHSSLGFAPLLFRYRFLTPGDADDTEYLLFYKTRVGTFMGLDRIQPNKYFYDDAILEAGGESNARRFMTYQPLLKDPSSPVMWSWILYDNMSPDGEFIPQSANNPFHDIILEVHSDHLLIRQYGQEPMFRLEANVDETFRTATATFEDLSGHDLVINSSFSGMNYLSSIPITIVRDILNKTFIITIVGDLTERYFIGNISDPRSEALVGKGMYDMVRVQNAKTGPWSTSNLATRLKASGEESFMTALHEDIAGDVDDASNIIDQEWDYRHLVKYGNVTTSSDAFGDQTAEFDGTSLVYLKDTLGDSNRSFRWDMPHPPVAVYAEFQPDILQNSTVLTSRKGEYKLIDDGTMEVQAKIPLNTTITRSRPAPRYHSGYNYIGQYYDSVSYIDPNSGKPVVLSLGESNLRKWTWDPVGYSSTMAFDSIGRSARWSGTYWDPISLSVKVARVHNDGTGLFVSAYDIDNNTYDTAEEYQINAAAFTHANDSLTSMYTNDSGHPILVIYSGSGWVQEDGIIEVDMVDKTAIQIATSNTFFPYTNFYDYNDSTDNATTYKDSNGDWITFAMRNCYIGQCYIHNHTTGVVDYVTLGNLLTYDQFYPLWGNADPNTYWPRRPWSLYNIPNTSYAIFLASPYRSYNHRTWYETLIDMDSQTIMRTDIPYYGYASAPTINYSRYNYLRSTSAATAVHGTDDTYNNIDELIHTFAGSSNGSTYGAAELALYDERTDVRSLYTESQSEELTYQTASANQLVVMEYPDFQLVMLNDKVAIAGPNTTLLDYGKGSDTMALSSFNIGGKFEYNAGTFDDPLSYVATDLYTGRVKNIVLKTQVPVQGSYKFPCHLYEIAEIDSFFTNFTGETTFVLFILPESSLTAKTYFLDTNNSLLLTEITDLNLATVTPNTISAINSSLNTIATTVGLSSTIGLIYYNIDGDGEDTVVSQTYVKYNCRTQAQAWDYNRRRRLSMPRMITKNGNCYYIITPMLHIYNHLNRKIYNNQEGNQYHYGYFNQIQMKDFTAAICNWNTSDLASADHGDGGCAFLVIDKEDNIVIRTLLNENYDNENYAPRHYMVSDVVTDVFDMSLGVRQVSGMQDSETMVFHKAGDADTKFYLMPGANGGFYNNMISNQLWCLPIAIKDKLVTTAYPYPGDAPVKFKETTNASGYKSWADLRWYFIDGAGTSFINDEMISFVICNTFGYAIDNWQVVSSFNTLIKGEIDVASTYNIEHSSAAEGSNIGFTKRAGVMDTDSTLVEEPVADDKFFILFDK